MINDDDGTNEKVTMLMTAREGGTMEHDDDKRNGGDGENGDDDFDDDGYDDTVQLQLFMAVGDNGFADDYDDITMTEVMARQGQWLHV